jgi:hypothetical protein
MLPRLMRFFSVASLSLLLAACATLPTPAPVKVPEVIQLSRAGTPPAQIIQKMRDAGMVYRLNASQIARLQRDGVSDAVLNYMQHTYIEAVRRDQRLRDWNRWWPDADGYFYGGCYYQSWPYGCH